MEHSKRRLNREVVEQGIFDKPWDCWLWPHGKNSKGYGRAKIGGVCVPVHRHSYAYHVGPIPTGLLIDHVCHTKACYNPYHLRPVTNKQNMEYWNGLDANNPSGYALDSASVCEVPSHAHVRTIRISADSSV